jgi:acetolactate synthase-1/2/3 large subunit
VLALVNAIDRASMAFVLCKHENAGGFMAEGAHHASGAPAVLVATIGPGAANAVNVVANAWQDRVPMLFITGCVDAAEAATYTHQVFDHAALLGAVTKASLRVEDGAVGVIVDKALSLAMSDPPGPVHLDLPISVAQCEQDDSTPVRAPFTQRGSPAASDALDAARRWFRESRKPLVIAGLEVLFQGAESALRDFVARHGIPTITTYKAKGVIDETEPVSLGGAGLSPKADQVLLPLVRASDFVLLVGYDPIEMRSGWRAPWDPGTHVVEFSAVANHHYVHLPSLRFAGDLASALSALDHDDASPSAVWPSGEPARARQALTEMFRAAGEQWGPKTIIETARARLPRDTVATVDSGAHRILLSQMWTCHEPRTLLQSTGLCTMGCALPLATGYKRSRPETTVAAFMGDACLEMVLGELATLRDLRQGVILFVFVDESLGLIELKQRAMGLANVGVDFAGTDFAAVAKAMGGIGIDVSNRNELVGAIDQALEVQDRFSLIACHIGRRAYDGSF